MVALSSNLTLLIPWINTPFWREWKSKKIPNSRLLVTLIQMEKRVQVISVCTILPATYKPSAVPRRIDLTPFDLQFLSSHPTQVVLAFTPDLLPYTLDRLKQSLSRTLDFFYPLAGHMCSINDINKDSSLFYIECNNTGVEFTHAVLDDITIADLVENVGPDTMRLLFTSTENKCDYAPFLVVQVTELAKGGFVLSYAMSHAFGDGGSALHFIISWAEICRGCESPKSLPVLDRSYPGLTEIWIPNRLIVKPPSMGDISLTTLKEKSFKVSKEKMSAMKQKAIQDTGIRNVSSLQALVSFMWKITSRYRKSEDEDEVLLVMVINARTKITTPPFAAYYLGNAVYPAMTSMKVKDLRASDSLGRVASKVHDLVMFQTEARVKDFITSWIEKSSKRKGSRSVGRNTLYIGGSPQFNVYESDFSWGRPVVVKIGPVSELDGKIMMSGSGENGGASMEICLPIETMKHLEKDSEFEDIVKFVNRSRL